MRTYNILHYGDIAFEGNKSKNFSFGRFVLNDLRDGIVSHVFNVYRPKVDMDVSFMKIYINNESVMKHILVKATTKTLMMTTLNTKDIAKQNLLIPDIHEQKLIGNFFKQLDEAIASHQRQSSYIKTGK
ncbi:restriction endonuclease subunit S [Testudinibacter sp. P80/BLE/0925]|uniref:restriction endonuclease subunit S n=1 Tax=Testudinibacter sp. TW-1 TaxID=3417757 RepID=UPI003D35D716